MSQHRQQTNRPPRDDDAYPYQQLTVLALCRLAEPIAFCSITAYTFVMVVDIKGEENASFYAGLLISAFAMAEACTAMVWGHISDRYGRKPIVLLGLAGVALSSLIFGFAKSYWVALLARVVGGLLNGNVAVMQTMVAEMVKRPEHEPTAYAVQPFVWSLGSIAGAALGGFTAQPARFYPHLFSPDGIFGEYPYLLPNLVAVAIIVVAIIQGCIFLEETNPVSRSSGTLSTTSSSDTVNETTPLWQRQRRESALSAFSTGPGGLAYVAESMPVTIDPAFDLRRPSVASIGSLQSLVKVGPQVEAVFEDEDDEQTIKPDQIKAFTKPVIMWTVALVVMSYHSMAFGSVLPIYLLDDPQRPPRELDLKGGLGMTLHEVGTYLAASSIMSLFFQAVVFPIFVAKLGVWKAVLSVTLLSPFIHTVVPFVSLLPKPGAGIYAVLAVQSFTGVISFPTFLILLKNATPSPLVLGKVNGLAMSACSAARTVGPPLVGIFYSSLGSAGAWWSCAVVAIIGVVQFYFSPRPRDDDETILRRASTAAVDVPPMADLARSREE
ncbi:hypothetical protein AYL99_07624 [Fonsecaea erecta]|uniref:Major facilitator superfamily (MFS) profile domain-containing protein n=1 Tax=Fonsecaea erecta TaxID=1367422 RepID=A0A178ZFH2_9EURO|nr:hypothetical protein AYL99_07624 [Fonsecaea erecta]OAP58534.1 hypothetical protein AYL99_07624 [Fonsecaea erecta]